MTRARAALIVAAYAFEDPKFAQLRAPARDAEALAAVLADPDIGGFEVTTLVNQRADEVSQEIEGFFADRAPDDLLLLYFSGHGVKDPNGRLYFAMANTKFARLRSTGVSASFVSEQMETCRSRRIALLLDCCYSGAFLKGLRARASEEVDVSEQFEGRGRAVITASRATEYAFEADELAAEKARPSIFTSAIVRGLSSGDADRNQDGRVTIDELYDYIYDHVKGTVAGQTPGRWVDVEGELVIARNPNPPVRPVELPAELERAVESESALQRLGAVSILRTWLERGSPGEALRATQVLGVLVQDPDVRVKDAAESALAEYAPTGEEQLPGTGPSPSNGQPASPASPSPRRAVEHPQVRQPVGERPSPRRRDPAGVTRKDNRPVTPAAMASSRSRGSSVVPPPAASAPHSPMKQANRPFLASGWLGLTGAALLVVTDFMPYSEVHERPYWREGFFALGTVFVAALVALASSQLMRARERRSDAAWLLAGMAPTMLGELVFFAHPLLRPGDGFGAAGLGFLVGEVSYIVIVLAALAAAVVAGREAIRQPPPSFPPALLAAMGILVVAFTVPRSALRGGGRYTNVVIVVATVVTVVAIVTWRPTSPKAGADWRAGKAAAVAVLYAVLALAYVLAQREPPTASGDDWNAVWMVRAASVYAFALGSSLALILAARFLTPRQSALVIVGWATTATATLAYELVGPLAEYKRDASHAGYVVAVVAALALAAWLWRRPRVLSTAADSGTGASE